MTIYRSHCSREFGTPSMLDQHQAACSFCRSTIERLRAALPPPPIAAQVDWRDVPVTLRKAEAERAPLKLIGLDPGLANFGWSIAELPNLGSGKPRFINAGAWRTEPSKELKRLRKMDDTAERCTHLAELLRDLVEAHRPIALCVEAIALPYRPGRGMQISVISALGRVRGLIDMLAAERQLAVLEESPQRVKKLIAGTIGATKATVQEALEREYPELRSIWPTQLTLLEHAADACAAIHACRGADVVLAARAAAARAA